MTEPTAVKSKGGRPAGYSPKATPPKQPTITITEDGDCLVIRVPKRLASKLILKDLL